MGGRVADLSNSRREQLTLMWPEMFGVPTYIIVYTLGIVTHGVLAIWYAHRMKISRWVGLGLGGAYLFGMFPGARILHDLLNCH